MGLAKAFALKQNKDFTIPSSHRVVIDEMANQNNSVRYFLSQSPRLRVGKREHEGMPASKTRTMGDHLFDEDWVFWPSAGGVTRVPRMRFHALMDDLVPAFRFELLKEIRNGAPTSYTTTSLLRERRDNHSRCRRMVGVREVDQL